MLGLLALVVLLVTIIGNGVPAFTQTYVGLSVELKADKLDPKGNRDLAEMAKVTTFGYNPLIEDALVLDLEQAGIETDMKGSALRKMLSSGAASQIRDYVLAHPDKLGQTVHFDVLASSRVDGYLKGRVTREALSEDKNLDAAHLDIIDVLAAKGMSSNAALTSISFSERMPRTRGRKAPASACRCSVRSS